MGNLVQGRSKYSDEDRRRAVVEYCVHGVMRKVAETTDIQESTLSHWKTKADWWDGQVSAVRSEINDHILAQNLQIATKAGERVLDSLENGDEKLVVDKETGQHIVKRVMPTGKDSMVMGGIAQDKAQRQLGLPTQIHGNAADVQIKSFIEEFRVAAQSFKEKQVNVVSTQGCEDESDN